MYKERVYLTTELANKIRNLYISGESRIKIMKKLNVSKSTVDLVFGKERNKWL